MRKVHIVNFGIGNIKSVQRGIEYAGGEALVCADPALIRKADRVVLPGVGAFGDGMNGLREYGMLEALSEFVATGKPLLGICLGMQMLFDRSEEFGDHQGLGFIPGVVKKIRNFEAQDRIQKLPNVGWCQLQKPIGRSGWNESILENVIEGSSFYFVHSYMAVPEDQSMMLAQCEYYGVKVTAAVQHENITGVQFHPEKSGKHGLSLIKVFFSL